MNKTEYLTTIEISKLLQCSRVYAWRLLALGKIKGERLGRQWIARPEDVQTYLVRQAAKHMEALNQ